MVQILVTVKQEGIFGMVLLCRPTPEKDGVHWNCASCGEICCRVSFGTMNGFWRCRCGLEVEVTVDGKPVDLQQFNTSKPDTESDSGSTLDEEFLKQCGIAAEKP